MKKVRAAYTCSLSASDGASHSGRSTHAEGASDASWISSWLGLGASLEGLSKRRFRLPLDSNPGRRDGN
jgi:hypothetical protein